MKLYNALSKKIEDVKPLVDGQIGIYSCGPTVYNYPHIGNLMSFIFADTLQRAFRSEGFEVMHVMNITDVDDKIIRDSAGKGEDPMQAMKEFTGAYEQAFYDDMEKVGSDIASYQFIRATDSIPEMQQLIRELLAKNIAYVAEDGIYFAINKYTEAGKKYGQLVDVTPVRKSESRIQNDEYDKDEAQDFALWKFEKPSEPAWDFDIDGVNHRGRPGWHIECSAMSRKLLGAKFDIHTGGIDLMFPHHENEIAQSTACSDDSIMANYFVHNEHMLVDGKKMSKSLGNFYNLRDIEAQGIEPMALRMFALQVQYKTQAHFSYENLRSAQNRLRNWRNAAEIRWQCVTDAPDKSEAIKQTAANMQAAISDNLDTPKALALFDQLIDKIGDELNSDDCDKYEELLTRIDLWLGLDLLESTPDLTKESKSKLADRAKARQGKDWQKSDQLRFELAEQGIVVRDAKHAQIWSRSL